jgi:hypothetical protein
MYRRYVELGMGFAARYPQRCFTLVYEQLVSEPQVTLAALMSWLGEQADPGQLAFNEAPHQRGLEDPKVASTTNIHTASAGRWVSVLDAHEVARIWSQTHDLVPQIDPAGWFTSALVQLTRFDGPVAHRLLDTDVVR